MNDYKVKSQIQQSAPDHPEFARVNNLLTESIWRKVEGCAVGKEQSFKSRFFILFILLLLPFSHIQSQSIFDNNKNNNHLNFGNDLRIQDKTINLIMIPKNYAYIEILGPGTYYTTLFYERILYYKSKNSVSVRGGININPFMEKKLYILCPFTANYQRKIIKQVYLELQAGIAYYSLKNIGTDVKVNSYYYTVGAGVKILLDKNLFFRLSINSVNYTHNYLIDFGMYHFMPGISFGYSF
jgi:hypothetical protein